MKLVQAIELITAGPLAIGKEWKKIKTEIENAIRVVTWPPGNDTFILNNTKHGNGVKPIKDAFMVSLGKAGWTTEEKGSNAYWFDAIKAFGKDKWFGLEWETGNISSSHRAINRILLAEFKKEFAGGALIVPTRKMYPYLTDRVGNLGELEPYFDYWRSIKWKDGILAIFAVEQDELSAKVPAIKKGTDGRNLV